MKRSLNILMCLAICLLLLSLLPSQGQAHREADPDLLTGWQIWLHVTIQWSHFMAFTLWVGGIIASLYLSQIPFDYLLFAFWVLFLALLATGTYNMEYSAGIPESPSLLQLSSLSRYPFGRAYTLVLGLKHALYLGAIFLTLGVNLFHLRKRVQEKPERVQQFFLWGSVLFAMAIGLVTTILLILHEAADLSPTPLHPLGGVVGHHAVGPFDPMSKPVTFLDGIKVLTEPRVIWLGVSQAIHLLGVSLWLGGTVWGTLFGLKKPGGFLISSWVLLILQFLSGLVLMASGTPFPKAPYLIYLHELSHIRFGRTYVLLMATKHLFVLLVVLITLWLTIQYRAQTSDGQEVSVSLNKTLLWIMILLGLAIAYLMMMVLLVHEGVDHVL